MQLFHASFSRYRYLSGLLVTYLLRVGERWTYIHCDVSGYGYRRNETAGTRRISATRGRKELGLGGKRAREVGGRCELEVIKYFKKVYITFAII
jgi:hypothetical protein